MFEEGKYLLSKRENKGEGKEGKRYKKEKYLVHGGKGRGGEYFEKENIWCAEQKNNRK